MSVPNTHTGIAEALLARCAAEGYGYIDEFVAAKLIQEWLAEARASAEPRLRPVSEKPEVGSVVVIKDVYAGWGFAPRVWGPHDRFYAQETGWVLLSRAPKPKTLAEEARELLAREHEALSAQEGGLVSAKWTMDVTDFIRRVAEEKRDE